MQQNVAIIDADEVIINLIEPWLNIYNLEFGQNLQKEEITNWDISKFVVPEAKTEIFRYIEHPDIFYASEPVQDSLWGFECLRDMGLRPVVGTANDIEGCKWIWLKEHGFIDDPRDLIVAMDKSLIRGNFLLDDRFTNCLSFQGPSFLFSAPWNQKHFHINRVNGWKHFIEKLRRGNV